MSCNSFSIITLDAKKILNSIKENNIEKGATGNFKVVFRFDLSFLIKPAKNSESCDIVLRKDDCPTNALFEQICKIVTKSPEKDSLLRYLVFIDFSKIFSRNISWLMENKTTPSKKDFLGENSLAYLTKAMFGEKGIELSFDGENYEYFVPFDKSANMARKSMISFVNSSIKEELEQRLMLDMDFSSIQVVLSKYYAYRGLYLSTARRIELPTLNKETVIVLPDIKTSVFEQVFTLNKSGEFCSEKKNISLNSFDGEGLICPEYVRIINMQLKRHDANSFQIRMPFTKGVLHSVDFLRFFVEEVGFEKDKPLLIKDIFGIERDLTKAKIILTKSMFKAGGWIKKLWESHSSELGSDPMQFFFKKMNNYEHTLYIATTDANLSNTGKIRLNYQFISTLALTLGEFDSLLEDGIDKIKKIPTSIQNILQASSDDADTDATSNDEENPNLPTYTSPDESDDEKFLLDDTNEEVSGDKEISLGKTRDKMLKALSLNDAFLRDPKLKSLIQVMQLDSEKSLFLGEFNVQGEVRFFSCDLLKLLLCIAEKIIGSDSQKENINKLNLKILESDYFYMPKQKMELEADVHYVFLRSPHLSRNEQCLLRPYVETESLYQKYFSHLTGVVMVSCKSSVPMALGGADFDGDLVKVISDSRIVEAVKRGVYYVKEKEFLRRLPVIQIPTNSSKVDTIPKSKIIPFEVIKNTFANQIGLISDLAVKLASVEYSSSKQESEYNNACAKATIVVGLEVDAAKTGKHPDEIQIIKELAKKTGGKSKFLRFKKIMKRLNTVRYTPIIEKTKNDGYEFYLSKKALKAKKATFSLEKPKNEVALLDLLPFFYLQYLYEKQNDKYKVKIKPRNKHYFAFEEDKNWRKDLESEKIDRLKDLLEAYSAVKRFAKKLEASREWWAKQKFDSFARDLLDIQYDDISSVKLSDKVTVQDALETVFFDLLDGKSLEDTEESLKLLREKNWHLTSKDDRNEKLLNILQTNTGSEVQLLLSNFRDNGFMLLFYVLSDKKAALKKAMEDKDYVDSHKKLKECIPQDNSYWKELYSEYLDARVQKVSVTEFLNSLVSICRKKLEDIFKDNEMKKALQYYWSIKSSSVSQEMSIYNKEKSAEEIKSVKRVLDPSRDFFWQVFTETEILENLANRR